MFLEFCNISFVFPADYSTCRKHWKNVRDRFVKVKHARDKHFKVRNIIKKLVNFTNYYYFIMFLEWRK